MGRQIITLVTKNCRKMIENITGDYGVQLGFCNHPLIQFSKIKKTFLIDKTMGDIFASGTDLPFESNSLDALLLFHALEASQDPHAVLREASRVLRPEGRLIIIGFNPYSLLKVSPQLPWRSNWISTARLKDWLILLQIEPQESRFLFFFPPFEWILKQKKLRCFEVAGRRWWPMAGGIFILHTIKHHHSMRPIITRFQTVSSTNKKWVTASSISKRYKMTTS